MKETERVLRMRIRPRRKKSWRVSDVLDSISIEYL